MTDQLAVALLEHVRALVELLVALEQPALEVAELGALGAALLLELPLRRTCSSLAWRMSSFCWARASATMRPALSCAALMDWCATKPRATKPTSEPAADHDEDDATPG